MGAEVMVGLAVEKSLETIVAMLAILKAGGAYIPLDPTYPQERLEYILQDSQVPVLVTQVKLSEKINYSGKLVLLDKEQEIIAQKSTSNLNSVVSPENLLYVIYTSGTTGQPKGVMINHYNVVRLFQSIKAHLHFDQNDIWTLFHSYSFGFSVWEIWGALLHGGKLVIVPSAITLSPESFYDLILQEEVTVLSQTPTAFRLLVHVDRARTIESLPLRYIIFSGEPLEPYLLKSWLDNHGDSEPQLVNMYAITETSGELAYRRLTQQDLSLNQHSVIGVPLPDVQIYLLNEQMQPVTQGEAGEMYIGGDAVGRGYLNQPQLTSEKFVLNPFDNSPDTKLYKTGDIACYLPSGEIEFLGRVDSQIKIRGYRIEPAEIEAKLAQHPQVQEAVVIAREDSGNKQLVAYIVPKNSVDVKQEKLNLQDFQQNLKGSLPDYMIPNIFVLIDKLPLSPNGKLDREGLPIIDQNNLVKNDEYIAPRNALEQDLAKVWSSVLKIAKISIHDNFFELGGDSIKGIEFSNRMQELWQDYVYITALFEAPTIAELYPYLCEHYPNTVTRIYGQKILLEKEVEKNELLSFQYEKIDKAKVRQFRSLIATLSPEKQVTNNSKNPQMAFILSPPRSGSTLLRIMLAGHPQLFVPPELELLSFNTLQERKNTHVGQNKFWQEGTIRAIMELQKCSADEATELMEKYEEQNLSIKRFYQKMQSWLGDRMLVEKSNGYVLDLNVLEKAETDFESPYYIHLLRHPYGMINSYEEIKLKFFFRYSHSFSERQLAELLWLIGHQNTLQFLAKIPQQRQYQVKFESLVQRPEQTLAEICQFLNIDYVPEMANPYQDPENRMTDGIRSHNVMIGDLKFHQHKQVSPERAFNWKENITEDFLGEITWEMAKRLGYQPESLSLEKSSLTVNREKQLNNILSELEQISEDEAQQLLNQSIFPENKSTNIFSNSDESFMRLAIAEAKKAIEENQPPYAACIVKDGEVVSCVHNVIWQNQDITAHAEIQAIREACKKLRTTDLSGCVIYSTCEPCSMCLTACHWAKIKTIFYGLRTEDEEKIGLSKTTVSAKLMNDIGNFSLSIKGDFLREEMFKVIDIYLRKKTVKYDNISEQYKKTKKSLVRTYIENYTLFSMIEIIGDLKEQSVLDLGCGEGYYSRIFKNNGAKEVVGIVISSEMIKLAIEEELQQHLGIDYMVSSIIDIGKIREFDLVVAVNVLHYACTTEELQSMIQVIYQNLKPGGYLVAINENTEQNIEAYSKYQKYGISKSISLPIQEGSQITYTMFNGSEYFEIINYYYSKNVFNSILESVGFKNIYWQPMKVSPEGVEKYGNKYWQDFLENPPSIGFICQK